MLEIMVVDEEAEHLSALRSLFREYNDYLGVDLSFQGFEQELAALPGKYGAAQGGKLYLARTEGEAVGCAGFYRLANGICELKRFYLRPSRQGKGFGTAFLSRMLEDAKAAGYTTMRLDSLRRLARAEPLYRKFGFYDIAPYNHNTEPDVYYMERKL